MSEYINKFEELNLQCKAADDLLARISKFKIGLHQEFQRKLITVRTASLEDKYEVAPNLETAMKIKQAKHSGYCGSNLKPNPLSGKPNFGNQSFKNPTNVPLVFKDNKGKGIAGEGSKWNKSVACHNCHGRALRP